MKIALVLGTILREYWLRLQFCIFLLLFYIKQIIMYLVPALDVIHTSCSLHFRTKSENLNSIVLCPILRVFLFQMPFFNFFLLFYINLHYNSPFTDFGWLFLILLFTFQNKNK